MSGKPEFGIVLVDPSGMRRYEFVEALWPSVRMFRPEGGAYVFHKSDLRDDMGLTIYRCCEVVTR